MIDALLALVVMGFAAVAVGWFTPDVIQLLKRLWGR